MRARADDCDRVREAASAHLDAEPTNLPAAAREDHLRRCAGCARWVAQATEVSRTVRLTPVDVPDLTEVLLRQVVRPTMRRRRRRALLRLALAAVGLVQMVIAVPDVFGDSVGMVMSMHAAHESAAWNAALGAAFLATAGRPRRAFGLLPALGAFVGILTLLSARDLAAGSVYLSRLSTHLSCVLGLLLVLALSRSEADDARDPAAGPLDARPGATIEPGLRGVA